MVNTIEIKKLMLDMGVTVKDLANKVGRSVATTRMKLNGERGMTLDEAEQWQEYFVIQDEDFAFYFMSHGRRIM